MWLAAVVTALALVLTNGQFQRPDGSFAGPQNPYNPQNPRQQGPNFPGPNFRPGGQQQFLDPFSKAVDLRKEPTYFIVASRRVRPGHVYKVMVNIMKTEHPISVRGSIQRNGVELSQDTKRLTQGVPEVLLLQVPPTSVHGLYRLRIRGNFEDALGGIAFINDTVLSFSQRFMTILVQMDKPVYKQGEIVRFRAIPINTELKAFNDPVDVFMIDPNGYVMRRWLSRQTNIGAVSLEYALADQVVTGNWKVKIVAQGQIEEKEFVVEEYFQTRFEVNVSMPAFFMDTDEYIYGSIEANYTSGAPVRANLTLRASLNQIQPGYSSVSRDSILERYIPIFEGTYSFRFPTYELERLVAKLDGMEIRVTAVVGDPVLGEVVEGFSSALIFNSSIKLQFLGSQPQVFKPTSPFKIYIVVSHHDNAPLSGDRGPRQVVTVSPTVVMFGGQSRNLQPRNLLPMPRYPGTFAMELDLLSEPGFNADILGAIRYLRLQARYNDDFDSAETNMLMVAQYAPRNHHLSVYTSSTEAKVGEYIIFHVRADFYLEQFSYVVMAKGLIVHGGTETISSSIKTFAVALSAEMAPSASVVVYHVAPDGEVVSDSLAFPVNGISRNKFNVTLNDRKAKDGDYIEVVVFGESGAYVGVSAMDRDMYVMQAGNELSHASVLRQMNTFEEDNNGTYSFEWRSRSGDADEVMYFSAPSYGIDANRTFEYAGLVIFTDANITRVPIVCNETLGFLSCLNGFCYSRFKRCDGRFDCEDGSDESNCRRKDLFDITKWKMRRRNIFERLYQNSWLWKDLNIGPHGYTIYNVSVPERPAHWVMNAFSMSTTRGFGLIPKPQQYAGARPFYMTLEMPGKCMQGEQVGLRVTLFNFMDDYLQVIVVLANNPDYRFVHVGKDGIVFAYNAQTSSGEHQHLIWLRSQSSQVVHMPIVPTRIGDINVTVMAVTQIGKYSVTQTINVDADGIPQYRHASVFLDLSNHAYMIKFIDVNLTETPIIPYQRDRYYVFGSNRAWLTVFGDVVGPAFPLMPMNATNLLRLPFGAAENNMFNFAYNLLTVKYMRITNQRQPELDKQAFYHLNKAYARQLSYQSPEGAFKPFRWNSIPSVWLTAFCARVFNDANFNEWEFFLYIDTKVISRAIDWILQYQTTYGAFYETSLLAYDRKMNLTSDRLNDPVRYRNISLTAHVLITLLSVRDIPGDTGARAANARGQALQYLEKMLGIIGDFQDPFELAITAYALTLAGSPYGEEAFNMLSSKGREVDGMMYWGREKTPAPDYVVQSERQYLRARLPYNYDASNIETTAYALLTFVERQALLQEQIVQWLNFQRLTDGGWASTQDTLVAMQALMEFTTRNRIREVTDLSVTLRSSSSLGESTFYVKGDTMAKMQQMQIPNAWGHVDVEAKGSGMAVVQMTVQYHVDIKKYQTMPPIQSFSVTPYAKFWGRNSSHINIRSCQSWILVNESDRSGMAVLEVVIPSGYYIQQQELDQYVLSRKVRNLKRARFFERKVVFYFDYLDQFGNCIDFVAERWYPVANMTRLLPIKVYDYYAPERFNETMFEVMQLYVMDICQVCGSYQCPYCPMYSGVPALMAATWAIIASLMVYLVTFNTCR